VLTAKEDGPTDWLGFEAQREALRLREIMPKIKHTITKRRMVFTPRPARLSLKFMILPSNLGEDAIFLDCCPSTQSGGR
jgi:hypothetical protein